MLNVRNVLMMIQNFLINQMVHVRSINSGIINSEIKSTIVYYLYRYQFEID